PRLRFNLGKEYGRAHTQTTRSEKIEQTNRERERHRHHTCSTTHGRHSRRRISHGLRLVNRTTRNTTRNTTNKQGSINLGKQRFQLQYQCHVGHQERRERIHYPQQLLRKERHWWPMVSTQLAEP